MKYLFQFLRILLFCLLGEILHTLIPLSIPASIYGLVLLLVALLTGVIRLEQIKETSSFLIGIMPLLFVPAAAGVMQMRSQILQMLVPILLALFPVTILVMVSAGRVTQAVMKKGERKNG